MDTPAEEIQPSHKSLEKAERILAAQAADAIERKQGERAREAIQTLRELAEVRRLLRG